MARLVASCVWWGGGWFGWVGCCLVWFGLGLGVVRWTLQQIAEAARWDWDVRRAAEHNVLGLADRPEEDAPDTVIPNFVLWFCSAAAAKIRDVFIQRMARGGGGGGGPQPYDDAEYRSVASHRTGASGGQKSGRHRGIVQTSVRHTASVVLVSPGVCAVSVSVCVCASVCLCQCVCASV